MKNILINIYNKCVFMFNKYLNKNNKKTDIIINYPNFYNDNEKVYNETDFLLPCYNDVVEHNYDSNNIKYLS
jgi:hypothetical protein